MQSLYKYCTLLLLGSLQIGCANKPAYLIQSNAPIIAEPRNPTRQLALFLDGTENDLRSKTNISVLSEIVKNQDKDNLYVFYNEGVGSQGDPLGAGTGLGINDDIAETYAFLARYYAPGSEIYFFGLSRGAYTARIVAGMVRSVGLYDLNSIPRDEERIKLSKQLYVIYKEKYSSCNDHERKVEIEKCVRTIADAARDAIHRYRASHRYPLIPDEPYQNVEIKAMGLWDTVEALGVVQTVEAIRRDLGGAEDPQNIVNPNHRYLDQICNVQHIYHALSLDDNRANLFTPVILTSDYVALPCTAQEANLGKIEEVWFSGAHADVGGGYSRIEGNGNGDFTDRDLSLSGISLNWMMSRLKRDAPNLLPKDAKVFENPYAYAHDAENGSLLYSVATREKILDKYLKFSRYKKLKIHASVIDRLSRPKTDGEKKTMGFDSMWYTKGKLAECFKEAGNNSYRLVASCPYIEVVY